MLHYHFIVENERKKKAKETTAAKKIEKATKADLKYSHGYAVLESSEDGVKQKRNGASDNDTENDSDDCIPEGHQSETTSSSSLLIPSVTASKKRKASPPKQSRILSQEEMKNMYPHLCLVDEDGQDETSPEKKVRERVLTLETFIFEYFLPVMSLISRRWLLPKNRKLHSVAIAHLVHPHPVGRVVC